MGTLVLAGATSGSTTLTPVDAVTTVLTLPSSTATLATLGANTFAGNQSITGTLGVTGAITGSATSQWLGRSGATTAAVYTRQQNTSGDVLFGIHGNAADGLLNGIEAYGAVLFTNVAKELGLGANGVLGIKIASGGAVTIPGVTTTLGSQASVKLILNGTTGARNWQFSVGAINSDFDFTPSTTNGGSTFTSPALSIVGSTGAVTIPGTLGVTGVSTLARIDATAAASTQHTLSTSYSNDVVLVITNTTATNPYGMNINFTASDPNDATRNFFKCSAVGTERATIRSNGGLANYSANNVNLSDANVKSRIEPIGTQWDAWKKIEWMKFKYDDQTHDDWNYGYTAQNIESIYPELVDAWQPDKEDSTLKAVYSEDLKNITGSVLQEAQLRIEQLEARLAALENK